MKFNIACTDIFRFMFWTKLHWSSHSFPGSRDGVHQALLIQWVCSVHFLW